MDRPKVSSSMFNALCWKCSMSCGKAGSCFALDLGAQTGPKGLVKSSRGELGLALGRGLCPRQ
ncbi:hypothetical protein AMTR_s00029p00120020 [Amborella trichopoda]|uniref:Uncharacterized protein n=1 Tax=Amborella trichopoda TaxID=13333 RepID=W1PP49_AMBTC|nr:hypothetical protein AMTR_s00029p00120020 [Amborella trichopoda]